MNNVINNKPLMVYTGNHLYHFTKFETGMKIIASSSLKFGNFANMNDIAEVKRDVYGKFSPEEITMELSKYQSISLTRDNQINRGFFIDPLWGHYADNGNGVCLVFNKENLLKALKSQFNKRTEQKAIKYSPKFTNALFAEDETSYNAEEYVKRHIDDIFFTKSSDWKYEQEFRVLLKSDNKENYFHFDKDSLVAVILCLPKIEKYKNSPEFIVLKHLLGDTPILHYTTGLGNKELYDENDNKMCNIIGVDLQLDL